jgi:hypothetical protein
LTPPNNNLPFTYFFLNFTPDSNYIVFISYCDYDDYEIKPELWIVSADGKRYESLSRKFDLDLWDGFFEYLPID